MIPANFVQVAPSSGWGVGGGQRSPYPWSHSKSPSWASPVSHIRFLFIYFQLFLFLFFHFSLSLSLFFYAYFPFTCSLLLSVVSPWKQTGPASTSIQCWPVQCTSTATAWCWGCHWRSSAKYAPLYLWRMSLSFVEPHQNLLNLSTACLNFGERSPSPCNLSRTLVRRWPVVKNRPVRSSTIYPIDWLNDLFQLYSLEKHEMESER